MPAVRRAAPQAASLRLGIYEKQSQKLEPRPFKFAGTTALTGHGQGALPFGQSVIDLDVNFPTLQCAARECSNDMDGVVHGPRFGEARNRESHRGLTQGLLESVRHLNRRPLRFLWSPECNTAHERYGSGGRRMAQVHLPRKPSEFEPDRSFQRYEKAKSSRSRCHRNS